MKTLTFLTLLYSALIYYGMDAANAAPLTFLETPVYSQK